MMIRRIALDTTQELTLQRIARVRGLSSGVVFREFVGAAFRRADLVAAIVDAAEASRSDDEPENAGDELEEWPPDNPLANHGR